MFTVLAYHNKCRSFTGSDGRFYRNELCFDDSAGPTAATEALADFALNDADKALLHQWSKVMDEAKQTANYNPAQSYGTYQIKDDLNTSHRVKVGDKTQTVYDYPSAQRRAQDAQGDAMAYHAEQVAPKFGTTGCSSNCARRGPTNLRFFLGYGTSGRRS